MKNRRLEKLFHEARNIRPDTSSLQTDFETRLAKRLYQRKEDQWHLYEWSWKLIPYFVILVILLGVLGAGVSTSRQKGYYYTYPRFDNTVLAAYTKGE